MALKRGSIVVVASRGAYTGKPRPALVVQSETLLIGRALAHNRIAAVIGLREAGLEISTPA